MAIPSPLITVSSFSLKPFAGPNAPTINYRNGTLEQPHVLPLEVKLVAHHIINPTIQPAIKNPYHQKVSN